MPKLSIINDLNYLSLLDFFYCLFNILIIIMNQLCYVHGLVWYIFYISNFQN
ncbi:hypothetical protein HanIR_Chr09g0444691 [Helianthus annuus]|nr:hypothetical protein HanIR_Chr09g0444691 [Helianthus annuus]